MSWQDFEAMRLEIYRLHREASDAVMDKLRPEIDSATARHDVASLIRLQREYVERMEPISKALAIQLSKLPPPPLAVQFEKLGELARRLGIPKP